MPDLEAAVTELQTQLGAALRDLARYERKERMAEVRPDRVRVRRAKLSADIDAADRRIAIYEERKLDGDLSPDDEAALKAAINDRKQLSAAAIEEYKGDPGQILNVGDPGIPDNPLNAPQGK